MLPELGYYPGWKKLDAFALMVNQLPFMLATLRPRGLLITAVVLLAWSVLPMWLIGLGVPAARVVLVTGALPLFLGLVLLCSVAWRFRPALRRDLIRQGFPLCVWCGHDLAGAVERCPECGGDTTDLQARAWEPLAVMALYPELAACRSREEAQRCLGLARSRLGVFALSPRLMLIGLLILNTVLWLLAFAAADRIALAMRMDLPRNVGVTLMIAAVLSFLVVPVVWYTFVIRSTRAAIRRVLEDRNAGTLGS